MIGSFKLMDSQTKWHAEHSGSDIGSIRFSPDGRYIGVGCFNGMLYVRLASRSRITSRIHVANEDSPVTCVRWHPKNEDLVYAATADGTAKCFVATTGEQKWAVTEKENTINSIDISPDAAHFVTVGSDCACRLYDMETVKVKNALVTKAYIIGSVSGHMNRIFTGVFLDENTCASCGWDDTVIMWDVRTDRASRTLFGPHVCGDAIVDVGHDRLVTGSWRDKDQIQLWDIGTGKCIKSVSIGEGDTALYVYTMAVTPGKDVVAAGGSNANKVSFVRAADMAHLSQTGKHDAAVNGVAFSKRQFVYGLANSSIYSDSYQIN